MIKHRHRLLAYIKFLPVVFVRQSVFGYNIVLNNVYTHLENIFDFEDITINNIAERYRELWRREGAGQYVTDELVTDRLYGYVVRDCCFHKAMAMLGGQSLARALCDADEMFWTSKLAYTDIKIEKTKAIESENKICKIQFIKKDIV